MINGMVRKEFILNKSIFEFISFAKELVMIYFEDSFLNSFKK